MRWISIDSVAAARDEPVRDGHRARLAVSCSSLSAVVRSPDDNYRASAPASQDPNLTTTESTAAFSLFTALIKRDQEQDDEPHSGQP
jgi:hypothetical protein